ncbi:Crp/Fnr family transcriptional regulator [Ramlibacter sp. PS3R-8]|uniref:Crp/Fnr family transcriptional regulator n=1 Tax=Ramlibacter sp. PS3R-8 TaxID=3133437 RepID=UPI0030975601
MLASLLAVDRTRLTLLCETVTLVAGQVLGQPRGRMTHAYFPMGAVVSLSLGTAGKGDNLEVALVGREGMVGLPLLLGGTVSEVFATVTSPGQAMRIGAAALRAALSASPSLAQRLHRYLLVSLAQAAQSAVCTRHHRLDKRLARWLLMAGDRVRPSQLHATHESLSTRLGVRRAGITRAAAILQQGQLIAYRRGEMTLLDRKGLEAVACACYAADESSYRRLMRSKAVT